MTLRQKLRDAAVEQCSPPEGAQCFLCETSLGDEVYRCMDCLPASSFCLVCLISIHKTAKLHLIEKWQVSLI